LGFLESDGDEYLEEGGPAISEARVLGDMNEDVSKREVYAHVQGHLSHTFALRRAPKFFLDFLKDGKVFLKEDERSRV
jgi:hypothetical protein